MPTDLLVVGLGNPGDRYAHTRHNVGARVVEEMSATLPLLARKSRYGRFSDVILGEKQVVLAKLTSYMNVSGPTVATILQRLGLKPEQLVVIYDDMNLPLGSMRVRSHGSAGGHNGMKSVIRALGTDEVSRIRLGIGRPPLGMDEVRYVLGRFTREEEAVMKIARVLAAKAITAFINDGVDSAMNQFNSQSTELDNGKADSAGDAAVSA
jgi:PTH1 family peptidyl-tRNA hydrolase